MRSARGFDNGKTVWREEDGGRQGCSAGPPVLSGGRCTRTWPSRRALVGNRLALMPFVSVCPPLARQASIRLLSHCGGGTDKLP